MWILVLKLYFKKQYLWLQVNALLFLFALKPLTNTILIFYFLMCQILCYFCLKLGWFFCSPFSHNILPLQMHCLRFLLLVFMHLFRSIDFQLMTLGYAHSSVYHSFQWSIYSLLLFTLESTLGNQIPVASTSYTSPYYSIFEKRAWWAFYQLLSTYKRTGLREVHVLSIKDFF